MAEDMVVYYLGNNINECVCDGRKEFDAMQGRGRRNQGNIGNARIPVLKDSERQNHASRTLLLCISRER